MTAGSDLVAVTCLSSQSSFKKGYLEPIRGFFKKINSCFSSCWELGIIEMLLTSTTMPPCAVVSSDLTS